MSDLPALPPLQPWLVADDRQRYVPADAGAVAAIEDAIALARHHVAAARAAGNDAALIRVLGYLGQALAILERHGEAVTALDDALRRSAAQDDLALHVATLIRRAEAARRAGELPFAEAWLREPLQLMEAGTGDDDANRTGVRARYEDFAWQHLGKTLLDAARQDEAIACLERALAIRQRRGDASLIASTEAALALARGDRSDQ